MPEIVGIVEKQELPEIAVCRQLPLAENAGNFLAGNLPQNLPGEHPSKISTVRVSQFFLHSITEYLFFGGIADKVLE